MTVMQSSLLSKQWHEVRIWPKDDCHSPEAGTLRTCKRCFIHLKCKSRCMCRRAVFVFFSRRTIRMH